MSFGQFVKIKRQQNHLKQYQVADAFGGLHPSTISLLEDDKREWRLRYIEAFAELIGVTVYQLMFEFHSSKNNGFSLYQTALRWFFSLSQDEIKEEIVSLFLAKEESWTKSHRE